jgi:hypothetical protein
MKYLLNILMAVIFVLALAAPAQSQCSVCTKTASQMGEKPAQGMNSGIIYLMMAPFAIVGFIGYRWWKGNKKQEEEEINSQLKV